jgi:putative copper resistance protein D
MQDGLILCRFVHFGTVLLLFGLGLFRHVLFTSSLRAFEAGPASRRLDRAVGRMACVALVSALSWLMLTAANMTDSWHDATDPQTLVLVLTHTFFGHVWILHLLLNGLVVLCAFAPRNRPRLTLLLAGLLLVTLAPVGHGAMYDGSTGQLLIFNQMLHLIGVGAWLGGLLMLATLLLGSATVDVRAVLARFSGIGYGLVALIVGTGMVNVRALSGAVWPAPALSGFGLVLGVKVAMVLCMLVLAGINRQLARKQVLNLPWLRISVLLECLFGAAALGAVSLLGTLPPMLT